jgi:hypothetical protein
LILFPLQPEIKRPARDKDVEAHRWLVQRVLDDMRFIPRDVSGVSLLSSFLSNVGERIYFCSLNLHFRKSVI